MDTSAIAYRVADFLKKHPPFQAMDDADLVGLARGGRVRFHEANDFILWQGEPHKLHVFVIQQGTVSLWDDSGGQLLLRDVRGAGDMLGVERFSHAKACLHSARSATDVVIYAFPASDFEALILKYPHAREFVAAYDAVTADYHRTKDTRDLHTRFLQEIAGHQTLTQCAPDATIADAARAMLASGSEAVAIVDASNHARGVVTASALLAWLGAGGGDASTPASELAAPLPTTGPASLIVDGVLALGDGQTPALALTSDGSPEGEIQALVTPRTVARVFGEQPIAILREIAVARGTRELDELNRRTRALVLQHLTSAHAPDWLGRFASLADAAIVTRIIDLEGGDTSSGCWCFCGAAGRTESLTRHAPQLVLLTQQPDDRARRLHQRVSDAFAACGYMARRDLAFDRSFLVASAPEWRERYEGWLRDPVRTQMFHARPLFDLRPIHGHRPLWETLDATIAAAVDRDFLQVLAYDCLASLPPLTFFQDAVVDEAGVQTTVFKLEQSALQPLVDVGRVFAVATRRTLGTSTAERFAAARRLLPEHESIFRDAAETLHILLWQQARIGIDQNTDGSELPPALLSRHDRHVLRSGFRSIMRLIEFTADSPWLDAL